MMAMMMPVVVVTSRYCIREEEAKLKFQLWRLGQLINALIAQQCSVAPLTPSLCGGVVLRPGLVFKEKKRKEEKTPATSTVPYS